MLEIRPVKLANLPDGARLCVAGKQLGDRPRAFDRGMENECMRAKLGMLRTRMRAGTVAYTAYRSDSLVGYLELHPIADALVPLRGEDCYVVACLRVPEEAERPETEVALIEESKSVWGDTRGLAALSRAKEWSGLGFEQLAEGMDAAKVDQFLWFNRANEGDPPEVIPPGMQMSMSADKVRVDLFLSDRCPWDHYVFELVRGVCDSMRHAVNVFETDCNQRRAVEQAGVAVGVAINGSFQPWFRPNRLPDEHTIRRAIENSEF